MTDHRAEAERWLWEFHDTINHVTPSLNDMLRLAHIHALLAQTPAVRMRIREGQWETTADENKPVPNDDEDPYYWRRAKLDELLPTIPADQVPTGAPLYAPSRNEILAYVSGKWHRKATMPARIDEVAGLYADQAKAGVTPAEVLGHRE